MYNYIGIDISILSTGICCIYDDQVKYGSIIHHKCLAKSLEKAKLSQVYSDLYESGTIDEYSLHSENPNDFLKSEVDLWDERLMAFSRSRAKDVVRIVNSLVNPEYGNKISIENYSFGSKGNATFQIVTTTVHIKQAVDKHLGGYTLISGPEVKKLAGKGNFNKLQMLNAFSSTSDCKLSKLLNSRRGDFVTPSGKTIKKPIDDLVDSYYLARVAQARNQ